MGCESSTDFMERRPISDDHRELIEDILKFWFPPDDWDRHSTTSKAALRRQWTKDEKVDTFLADNYEELLDEVAEEELEHWKNDMQGRLAYILLCDQFARRIHKGTRKAF